MVFSAFRDDGIGGWSICPAGDLPWCEDGEEAAIRGDLEKAGETIGCDGVPGVEHEARMMVEGLKQIREMIKETEGKIQELCQEFSEYEYLLTIPGFGPDVSSKVLGAIGDP